MTAQSFAKNNSGKWRRRMEEEQENGSRLEIVKKV